MPLLFMGELFKDSPPGGIFHFIGVMLEEFVGAALSVHGQMQSLRRTDGLDELTDTVLALGEDVLEPLVVEV